MAVAKASVLKVKADLLLKGYGLLRAESPGLPADLVLYEDGQLTWVEVTTGYQRRSNPTKPLHPKRNKAKGWDVLAIVVGDTIVYDPALPPIQTEMVPRPIRPTAPVSLHD